ncbi:MAG: coproporphyrinogen-III oxidase family protein [Verrucomicrobiota bacterium]
MDTATTQAKEKDTKAGNYFVSNYPPFSFWSPDRVSELDEAIESAPRSEAPLGLYVHIPFCRKRCHFCYFRVYTGAKSQEIRTYIDGAIQELDLYCAKPFIGNRAVDYVYFGGGTPSFLSTTQLKTLTDAIKERLPWDKAREITFECEPGTLNNQKLQFIRDLGITRLSLGVENFDPHILEVNGRAHRGQEIDKAYQFARDIGFPQINIDLIAGMMDETDENWADCIEKTIERMPDCVTIYQMEIPFNTTIYQQMKDAGKVVAPVADWETKRRWVKYAFEKLEENGYDITSAYTAVRRDKKVDFVYRDELWRGADMLSLGVASFGHINGVHYQNDHNMEGYLERLGRGERPVYRAMKTDDEELLIREFILQFKTGSASPAYFQTKFGVDILEKFKAPLKLIRDWGFLISGDEPLQLTRDGLLEVDRILHEFFLPQHRNVRYA